MDNNEYNDRILLKLKRKYGKYETIALCVDKISRLEVELGKEKSYSEKVFHENQKLKNDIAQLNQKLNGERALSNKELNKLKTNSWVISQVRDHYVASIEEREKKLKIKIKQVKEQFREVRDKYLNIISKAH